MPDAIKITPTERHESEALNNVLGLKYPVLNDGFVRAVDYMGGDASIVRTARVSYGAGTKKIHEDRGLIRYLMRHRHTTPFEMCTITFHVRVPMDHWRQWIRHRTASVNEYSTRYSDAIDSIEKTNIDEWRSQSKKNKQGSAESIDDWPDMTVGAYPEGACIASTSGLSIGQYLSRRESDLHELALEVYQERLALGVAREQARKDLPLSQYTEAYWKMDLHNLFHFLSLRLDSHAQLEIRLYAQAIARIIKWWVPDAYSAFEDYRLNGVHLTALDIKMIKALDDHTAWIVGGELGWLEKKENGDLKDNRERDEFDAKAEALGFVIPW